MKHLRRIPVKMGHITNWQITVVKHISCRLTLQHA